MEYLLKKIYTNTEAIVLAVLLSFILNFSICLDTCTANKINEKILSEIRETNKKLDLIIEQKK